MKKSATVFLIFFLAGCSTTQYWTKPHFSQAQFNKDNYACERDMFQSFPMQTGGLIQELAMKQFREQCMESKGYYETSQ